MITKVFFKRSIFQRFCLLGAVVGAMSLSGCDAATNMLQPDREAGYEVQDYRDVLSSRVEKDEPNASANTKASSIPKLQPFIAESSKSMNSMPLVSISVNQSVPLRDVLFELAKQAEYDLELDPNIRGSVIFTARNRPFDEVIERLSVIGGLRYKLDGHYLRVELDTPYNKVHKIDYLSYIRSSSGSIRNDVAVVTGDGADTGSDFEASSEVSIDFWAELEANITQILAAQRTPLRTSFDPTITAVTQIPDVAAVVPPGSDGNIQPPDAILRVDSLPVNVGGGQSSGGGPSGGDVAGTSTYSINKQAGLVNVYAPDAAQREVTEYLKLLKKAVTAQVLIEAKILQVSLSDENQTGIDWATFSDTNSAFGSEFKNQFGFIDADGNTQISSLATDALIAPAVPSFLAGFVSGDIGAFIEALSKFGTVKALASPRLTVLNNQPAVLNVATNQVFFDIDISREPSTDPNLPDVVDVDTEIRNVPVGVLVNVQPSVNLDTKTISMAIRPTITAVADSVQNPGLIFAAQSAGLTDLDAFKDSTSVPELNVQEIDTVISVNSGQAVVMGGLLSDAVTNNENGVPVLSEIPMVGSLFKQKSDRVKKTELVIFLQATILDKPSDSVHDTDRDIYRAFSSDRRPLKF